MEQMEQSVQVLDYKGFVLFHGTEHYRNKRTKWRGDTMSQVASASLTTSSLYFYEKKPSLSWVKLLPLELLNIFTDINKNAFGFFSVPDL
jgi:hypothetical protein